MVSNEDAAKASLDYLLTGGAEYTQIIKHGPIAVARALLAVNDTLGELVEELRHTGPKTKPFLYTTDQTGSIER